MKNQILDEPIRDSFFDYLEKGEKILWEGEPVRGSSNIFISIWFLIFLLMISLSIYQNSKSWLALLVFLILIVTPFVYANFKQINKVKKIRYAITQQRVFFRQLVNQKIQINSISFKHIPRVYLNNNDDFSKKGDISFLIKKSAKGKFWTYHIDNSQALNLPTFQQIENPKKVMKLLHQQINNHNSHL